MSEHLHRARSARPLLDVPQQLVNITSLSNVVSSRKSRLQRVVELGRNLLRRCRDLAPHQCPWQSNVEEELTHLAAAWRQLERIVSQQKQRLESLNATDPERQLHDCLVLFILCLFIMFIRLYIYYAKRQSHENTQHRYPTTTTNTVRNKAVITEK